MGVEMDPTLLREVVNGWLLGADPEFAVVRPPDTLVANAGQYATEVTDTAGGIGGDHHGRVWEVRPAPSHSAYAVTTNIWRLLKLKELDRVADFKWKGGALGARKSEETTWATAGPITDTNHTATMNAASAVTHDTLGGHVHFGIGSFNAQQRDGLNKMTTALLNLDILPRKENSIRIKTSQYGRFDHDAVRTCDGHVEYRCAPSWLDRPGQAFCALTAYKLAGARPSTVDWSTSQALKASFLEWLSDFAKVDVDAFLLDRLIERRGLEFVQADPESNFRPRWRKEDLWAR
jgi:hypothetical protein